MKRPYDFGTLPKNNNNKTHTWICGHVYLQVSIGVHGPPYMDAYIDMHTYKSYKHRNILRHTRTHMHTRTLT